MNAHIDAGFFQNGGNLVEEVVHIAAKLLVINAFVGLEGRKKLLGRQIVHRAGKAAKDGIGDTTLQEAENLLEEMRVAFLLHRLNSSNQAPDGYDILKMATRGSAKLLGREKLGQIAVGMAADFFLIRQNRLALVGTRKDMGAVLATVGFRENVDVTVVNGRVVVKNGRLLTIDEEKTAFEANQVWQAYLNR